MAIEQQPTPPPAKPTPDREARYTWSPGDFEVTPPPDAEEPAPE